jgi:hypothetical protein
VQRHLAALKPTLLAAPGPRPHTFVSPAGGLAVAGTRAAADSLRLVRRSRIGS